MWTLCSVEGKSGCKEAGGEGSAGIKPVQDEGIDCLFLLKSPGVLLLMNDVGG